MISIVSLVILVFCQTSVRGFERGRLYDKLTIPTPISGGLVGTDVINVSKAGLIVRSRHVTTQLYSRRRRLLRA